MDEELAGWLAELIARTLATLEEHPGLTCEVQGEAKQWLQVVPEPGDDPTALHGVVLNFAYPHSDPPLDVMGRAGLKLPPGTRVDAWEAEGFARVWVRPDIPVVALAFLAGDIIEKVVGAAPGYELAAWIEYGF